MSETHKTDPNIKSPCIRQCCLDGDDVCVGCYRTITEIMDWQKSTQSQKLEVLANCSIRKKKHDFLHP
ncbi:DUF1289 domain-containing protein [Marinomonas rhizomae]|uniref:DUF1289 domain-containing protein n=1 Tax=Marinomonas rhizomae TaxID=491948 RepID=UPI0021058B55|nr:DUF1289 domain-containing protein [Marinomonas rhizomae]UTW00774.1 DUF1289 domain-containing protein [Marinomonas rhizomae]